MIMNGLGACVNGAGVLLVKGADQQARTFRGLYSLHTGQSIRQKLFSDGLPRVNQLTFAERLASVLVTTRMHITAANFQLTVRHIFLMLHQNVSLYKAFPWFHIHRDPFWNHDIAGIRFPLHD